jgi:hypothetical protein
MLLINRKWERGALRKSFKRFNKSMFEEKDIKLRMVLQAALEISFFRWVTVSSSSALQQVGQSRYLSSVRNQNYNIIIKSESKSARLGLGPWLLMKKSFDLRQKNRLRKLKPFLCTTSDFGNHFQNSKCH